MSIALMTRVWATAEPREAVDRLMLLALADNANDAGVCWPSVPTLARKCGVEKRAALDTLGRLEDAGHLVIERWSGRGNVYHLPCASGAVRRTGAASRTGAADATGTGAVRRTGPVQPTAPEPSENPKKNPHSNNSPTRGASKAARNGRVVVGEGRSGSEESFETIRPERVSSGLHVDALVDRGVTAPVAERLAVDFGERIDAAIAAFDRNGTVGPGWLVRAVENGWAEDGTERASVAPATVPAPVEPLRNRRQALNWLSERDLPLDELDAHFEETGADDNGGEVVTLYRRRPDIPDAQRGVADAALTGDVVVNRVSVGQSPGPLPTQPPS